VGFVGSRSRGTAHAKDRNGYPSEVGSVMHSRTAVFAVSYREEVGPVGPYIPTLGYPTSATDM
jgi:hypothetical protein